MFGHRPDGRRVRNLDPIIGIMPYLMPMRVDGQVFLDYDVDYEPVMRYIAKKSREGVKITFMELIIASYIRAVSQVPEINRFIMNKQYFNRKELTSSFTILMDTDDGSIVENVCKIYFDLTDTIYDVSARVKAEIARNRKAETSSFTLKFASIVQKIPGVSSCVVWLLRFLDRYGLLPKALIDAIPMHTSMFITNNASIGLMKVYHHIYNFGTTSAFFALGTPKRGYTVDAGGNVLRKCTLPIGVTVDERVCGGAIYAKFFSIMKNCFKNPEQLEVAPEKVYYNEDAEFHVAKPENVVTPETVKAEAEA